MNDGDQGQGQVAGCERGTPLPRRIVVLRSFRVRGFSAVSRCFVVYTYILQIPPLLSAASQCSHLAYILVSYIILLPSQCAFSAYICIYLRNFVIKWVLTSCSVPLFTLPRLHKVQIWIGIVGVEVRVGIAVVGQMADLLEVGNYFR